MPNPANVDSPITIVAYGRSGTSLLARVFEHHPDFSLVGETGNFICDLWRSFEFSAGVIAPAYDKDGVWVANSDRQGRLVRDAVVSCFPDDKAFWCQKPIGVPVGVSSRFGLDEWDEAAKWYWGCFKSSFPRGRFITVLRHPLDVVRSAMSYWGYEEKTIWWSLAFTAHLISHPESPIEYAVAYDELADQPERTVRDLFSYLDMPFDPVVLRVFETVHVPSAEGLRSGLGRSLDWSCLHPEDIDAKFRDAIERMFAKFGRPVNLPALRAEIGSPAEAERDVGSEVPLRDSARHDATSVSGTIDDAVADALAAAEERHREVVAGLSRTIEKLHSEYASKLAESSRLVELASTETFNRLQGDLQWMNDQLEESCRYAKELEGAIAVLEKSIADREKDLDWYIAEREAWVAKAEQLERGIEWHKEQAESLQSCIAERDQGIAWLQTQCLAWEKSAAESAALFEDVANQLSECKEALARQAPSN